MRDSDSGDSKREIPALPGVRRTQPDVVSKNLATNTELTLMMPVKPGFVPCRDTVTYATRARLLMGAFHGFRQISREAADLHPFVDVVERIGTIQSYRLNLLENDTKLLLAVSFDQPWEPYIRRIWRDTGPFLDAILCNCVGYEEHASRNGFEAFSRWVRETQVDTSFFYIADNLTVGDREYLERYERRHREGPAQNREADLARLTLPDIELEALKEQKRDKQGAVLAGLRALGVLYRLNDLYPATQSNHDHEYYFHAVRRLLENFDTENVKGKLRDKFRIELDWYEQRIAPQPHPKPRPKPRTGAIQGGILSAYQDITHGAMLLCRVTDPTAAGRFIRALPITREGAEPRKGKPRYNISFTYSGLVNMRVDIEDLRSLPQEFREGMEARAGMLGDLRSNHPSNWNLPKRLVDTEASATVPRVQMSSVDFVLQLRCAKPRSAYDGVWGKAHPLFAEVQSLDALVGREGIQILSVQGMGHQRDPKQDNKVREHFGFVDGLSQPELKPAPNLDDKHWNNEAAIGDVLVGHNNSYYDPAYDRARQGGFLDNGTFLVVRKLRQDVAALEAKLPKQTAQRNKVLSKMMGRTLNGRPLISEKAPNEFDYAKDPDGDRVPIHAHIRRTNPREVRRVAADDRQQMIRVPRLLRRGMSYGPKYTEKNRDAERGLVFMTYNASIAEQFEIVQRWMSGSNSSGGYSGQSDPFMGVPKNGQQRTFRYMDGNNVVRHALDDPNNPQPIVKLEWGLYLFTPSIKSLDSISRPGSKASLVARGQVIIDRLRRIEEEQALGYALEPHEVPIADQWKALLEDVQPSREENLDAVWAAIRANYKGVLRTPYGILVGSERLVKQVLADDGKRYSVRKYWWRLQKSFGDIYLSMDPRPKKYPGVDPTQPIDQKPYHEQVGPDEYHSRSQQVNKLLNGFDEPWAYEQAYRYALGYIQVVRREAIDVQGNLRVRDLVDFVLGNLSKDWFGIPDGERIQVAGEPSTSDPDTLHCPYHFVASSRYAFSPNPSNAVQAEGEDHGSRLHAATEAWIRDRSKKLSSSKQTYSDSLSGTPIGDKMFEMLEDDPSRLASELIGVMHGFLPSTLGNLLKGIGVWIDDGTLWRLQEDYLADATPDAFARANRALRVSLFRVMQYRPMPDLLHRVSVAQNLSLSGERVSAGETVVLGVGSASAELLDKGKADPTWVFGGDYPRYALDSSGKPNKALSGNKGSHGCPGRKIAVGTMLGILAALMEAGQIRAEPAPLILTIQSA